MTSLRMRIADLDILLYIISNDVLLVEEQNLVLKATSTNAKKDA